MLELNQISEHLLSSVKSTSRIEREAATLELRKCEARPQFLGLLFGLSCGPWGELSQAAAVRLFSLFKEKPSKEEIMREWTERLAAAICSKEVDFRAKKHFSHILHHFVYQDHRLITSKQLIEIMGRLTNRSSHEVEGLLLIVQALVLNQASSTNLNSVLFQLLPLVSSLLQLLTQAIPGLNRQLLLSTVKSYTKKLTENVGCKSNYLALICSSLPQRLVQVVQGSGCSKELDLCFSILTHLVNQEKNSKLILGEYGRQEAGKLRTLVPRVLDFMLANPLKLELYPCLCDLLQSFFSCRSLYHQAHRVSKTVALEVVLQMLATTPQEYRLLEREPRQFITVTTQNIDAGEGSSLKLKAIRVLQSIVDHMDGMCLVVMQTGLQLVRAAREGEEYCRASPLSMVRQCSGQREVLLQTGFFLFTLFSYINEKRKDFVADLVILLRECYPLLKEPSCPVIVKVRFIFLLSYNTDYLTKDKALFGAVVPTLIETLTRKPPACLALTGLDFFRNLLHDDALAPEVSPFVLTILTNLILIFQSDEEAPFELYQIVQKCYSIYSQNFDAEEFMQIVSWVVGSIVKEEAKCRLIRNHSELFLKQFGLLQSFCQLATLPLLPLLEAQLMPLTTLLEQLPQSMIQEQFVGCLCQLIKRTNCLSQFLLHSMKQKYALEQLYKLFTLILHSGRAHQQPALFGLLMALAQQSVQSENRDQLQLIEGLLVVHLGLQVCGHLVDQEAAMRLALMSKNLVAGIEWLDSEILIDKNYGVFLLLFFLHPRLITAHYEEQVEAAIRSLSSSNDEYDRRLLALALIQLAEVGSCTPQNLVKAARLVKQIIEQKHNFVFLPGDDDSSLKDYQKLMRLFSPPLLKVDEIDRFRKAIEATRFQYGQEEKELIGFVLSHQRVKTEQGFALRKVYKVKCK